jgi:hypothetical protein
MQGARLQPTCHHQQVQENHYEALEQPAMCAARLAPETQLLH